MFKTEEGKTEGDFAILLKYLNDTNDNILQIPKRMLFRGLELMGFSNLRVGFG